MNCYILESTAIDIHIYGTSDDPKTVSCYLIGSAFVIRLLLSVCIVSLPSDSILLRTFLYPDGFGGLDSSENECNM